MSSSSFSFHHLLIVVVVLLFGVVVSGDEKVAYSLESFAAGVEETFDGMKKEVSAEVTKIHGGKFPYMHDFEPNNFLQSDYDENPGQTQFDGQVALGRQNIFQICKRTKWSKHAIGAATRFIVSFHFLSPSNCDFAATSETDCQPVRRVTHSEHLIRNVRAKYKLHR